MSIDATTILVAAAGALAAVIVNRMLGLDRMLAAA